MLVVQKKSNIHGDGGFAGRDFSCGELVEYEVVVGFCGFNFGKPQNKPNIKFLGNCRFVCLRDIKKGEELLI